MICFYGYFRPFLYSYNFCILSGKNSNFLLIYFFNVVCRLITIKVKKKKKIILAAFNFLTC